MISDNQTKRSTRVKKRKDEILKIALKLFISKGYETTSTSDICLASKITKPTLYWYFPSKRHILHAAHVQSIETVIRPYLDKSAAIMDPIERLYSMLKEYTTIVCSYPEVRFLVHETINIKDGLSKEIRKEWKRHYLLLRDTIAELQTNGSVRAGVKPSGASLMLLGMITWITYWFDFKKKNTIDETVGLVTNMVSHALSLPEHKGEVCSKKIKKHRNK